MADLNWKKSYYESWDDAFRGLAPAVRQQSVRVAAYTQVLFVQACADGFANDRQIGLSGRTVRPKLIITCGISGAIQFASCMKDSDFIVSINSDRNAPIFDVANVAIVDDLYRLVPELIEKLKGAKA